MKYWCWRPHGQKYRNFGDELTGLLLEYIYPEQKHERVEAEEAELIGVGSILHTIRPKLREGTIVWGSGGGYFPEDVAGLDVRAVRGAYTRDNCGLPADTVLGDPAILLPLFIEPAPKKIHKLGIVKHMGDSRPFDHPKFEGAHIINALENPRSVIEQITSCEYVLSSSLHGWIVAYTYGVPAMPYPIDEGNKFYDFMSFLIETQSLESARERLLVQLRG